MLEKIDAFQIKRAQRISEITSCAKQKFITNGISNTSMKEIATSLSITRVTLYKYFSCIDALIYEIERQALSSCSAWLSQIKTLKGNALQRFEQAIDIYLSLVTEHADDLLFTALFDTHYGNCLLDESMQTKLESIIHHFDYFYHLIEAGKHDGTMRFDLDATITNYTVNNLLVAMMQRMVVRGLALSSEQGIHDFNDLLIDLKRMLIYYVRKDEF